MRISDNANEESPAIFDENQRPFSREYAPQPRKRERRSMYQLVDVVPILPAELLKKYKEKSEIKCLPPPIDPQLSRFVEQVSKGICQHFKSVTTPGRFASVRFKINVINGTFYDAQMARRSGSPEFDAQCIAAVEQASGKCDLTKSRSLPEDSLRQALGSFVDRHDSVEVEFRFPPSKPNGKKRAQDSGF